MKEIDPSIYSASGTPKVKEKEKRRMKRMIAVTTLLALCIGTTASCSLHTHEAVTRSGKTSPIDAPLKLTYMSFYPKPKSLPKQSIEPSSTLAVEKSKIPEPKMDQKQFIRLSKKSKNTVGKKHGRPNVDYRRYVLNQFVQKIRAEQRQILIKQLIQEAQSHVRYFLSHGYLPLLQEGMRLLDAYKTVEQIRKMSEAHFKMLLNVALLVDVYEVLGQVNGDRSARIRPMFQSSREKLAYLQGLKARISRKMMPQPPKGGSTTDKL